MTSRRSFFKRLASIVAVVALAPEIAFARKLETAPALNLDEMFECLYWIKQSRIQSTHSEAYIKWREKLLKDYEP